MTGSGTTSDTTTDARAGFTVAKETRLWSVLAAQREAFLRDGAPSLEQRRSDLLKLKDGILAHRRDFESAIKADFGHRSAYETAIMEIMPTVQGIHYLRKNLRRWMRPRARRVAMQFRPGTAKVVIQPLGVVGIISPWNYPASLSLMPLATAIAAGDRAMLKPSEHTPRTSELIVAVIRETFADDQVAVVTGGADVGEAFAALPFDHLVFTGSTRVGRAVMRAAAANLVPVTLELGGKSPAIVDRGFSPTRAAKSIAYGKLSNAGQTCIAPDYALVHESKVDAFVAAFDAAARAAYPAGAADEAYSAIVSQVHYDRLAALVEDAKRKGANVVEIGPAQSVNARKLPPTLVIGATPEMSVMQDEIFGPILPIVSYKQVSDAVACINANPRPLALYLFSDDRAVVRQVLERTTSGNVTVNDTLLHYAQDDLPFGGVGLSGMGAYHGEEGFLALSHAKGVFTQARWSLAGLTRPRFGRLTDSILNILLR
ncbi:MAG TPA: coniferyl aldehyde dehydrogenase [Gammaproteobacteria bacterium]|nr:coniferyl aldehyde dehydrogenase [Gammaproteobacteria bacterium]